VRASVACSRVTRLIPTDLYGPSCLLWPVLPPLAISLAWLSHFGMRETVTGHSEDHGGITTIM
jgi:hypothetical protein